MSIEFKEFPVSYRMSQGGIVLAFSILFIGGAMFRQNAPMIVRAVGGSIVGAIAVGSMLVSQYVICRYPYLSLVEASDGDLFSKHITAPNSKLYSILKWLSIFVIIVLIGTMFFQGIKNTAQTLVIIYLILLLGFLLFLAFKYDAVSHPTVATYIRSTIGIGIVLFPFFIPALMIGSARCRQMLDAQEFAGMMDDSTDESYE